MTESEILEKMIRDQERCEQIASEVLGVNFHMLEDQAAKLIRHYVEVEGTRRGGPIYLGDIQEKFLRKHGITVRQWLIENSEKYTMREASEFIGYCGKSGFQTWLLKNGDQFKFKKPSGRGRPSRRHVQPTGKLQAHEFEGISQ